MKELGIQMIPAYSPQARGRSERSFGTWQGRLPQELRLAGIGTVEKANEFLNTSYIVAETVYEGSTARPGPWGSNTTAVGTTQYAYSGATTTVTDPASKVTSSTVDSLGRLVTVDQGGVSSASYSYTLLDSLSQVLQSDPSTYGGAVTQTRTFGYSSLNRLLSADNPESGLTMYSYFAGGSLKRKTDARGVYVEIPSLDGLKRPSGKNYVLGTNAPAFPKLAASATPNVTYCYDGLIYSGGGCVAVSRPSGDKPVGKMTGYGSQVDGGDAAQNFTFIDALGRVRESSQRLKTGGGVSRFLSFIRIMLVGC